MFTLQVTLIKAFDLPASDVGIFGMGGKSDPYVVFKVGRTTHKSSVIDSNLSPVWNPPEEFTFQVANPSESCLEVRVFDHDRITKDDLIGTTTIALAQFVDRPRAETTSYELDPPDEFVKQRRNSAIFLEIKLMSETGAAGAVLELWENQRYHLLKKWTHETFKADQRKRWSLVSDSKVSSESFEEVAPPVPAGMNAEGWTLDVSLGDDNGWIYAPTWAGPWQRDAFSLAYVRRRKWVNRCSVTHAA